MGIRVVLQLLMQFSSFLTLVRDEKVREMCALATIFV